MNRPAGGAAREPVLLLVLALLAFTANIGRISLPSIDDCFYAQKGVEMGRSGGFFTVTWDGAPSFTYPPLQFWILGRSFALLGEHDAAARLPSALMALGVAAMTWWIARRVAGHAAGATTGLALLLMSPYLLNNARRCMTEVPLCFWTTMMLTLLIGGLRRPWLHALIALPLAAAFLTKSLIALLPLGALVVAALVVRDLRAAWRRPWLWLGVALGLAGGASWSLHQWSRFGPAALAEHYVSGALALSTRALGWAQRLFGYALILVRDFQPLVVPALAGSWAAWRGWRASRGGGEVMVAGADAETRAARLIALAWWVVPFVLAHASSTQSARYLFPALPALAALGGWWLAEQLPRVALVARRVAMVALAAVAVIFWVAPGLLGRDANRAFREQRALLQARIPADERVPFLGHDYWRFANPLLWYAERRLENPAGAPSSLEAIARARTRSGVLLAERAWLAEVTARVPGARVVFEAPAAVLIDVGR